MRLQTSAAENTASGETEQELPVRFVESLGLLGHELRNSLSCITAVTALMRNRSPDSEKERRRLAMIDRAARRMSHIVSSTLDCAQAARGPVVLAPRYMDLRAACEDVVEEALAAHPVVIRLSSGDSLWGCWDPVGIAQVLSNLIRNAIVHGAEDEPIIVDLTDNPSFVNVTVTNRGPVIPPEFLPSIFEPWKRGPGAALRPRQSLGLGLHVVRRLVEAHGGSVTVESAVERGTSFSVELPRRALVAGAAEPPSLRDRPASPPSSCA
jgi:signal transduction histidine kinase